MDYQLDSEGNYMATIGVSFSGSNPIDIDPGQSVYNVSTTSGINNKIYVCKLDSNFNLIWAKPFSAVPFSASYQGSPMSPHVSIHTFDLDKDDNILISGSFTGIVDFDPGIDTTLINYDGWVKTFICKLNKNGELLWVNKYNASEYCYFSDAAIDTAGNVITFATLRGQIDFNPAGQPYILSSGGHGDMFVYKLSPAGSLIWVRQIGSIYPESAGKIKLDNGGDIYLSGEYGNDIDFDPGPDTFFVQFHSNINVPTNGFFLKLNSSGNFVFVHPYPGIGRIFIDDYEIIKDKIYITGSFFDRVDFNSGTADSIIYTNVTKGYLLQIDTSGTFQSVRQFDFFGTVLEIDESTNYYLSGTFSQTVDFDPGPGTNSLTSTGVFSLYESRKDVFILKLDSLFNFQWVKQLKCEEQIEVRTFDLIDNEDLLIHGWFRGPADLDPGPDTFAINTLGFDDVYVLKLTTTPRPVGVSENQKFNTTLVYPNPGSGRYHVQLDNVYKKITVKVRDLNGKLTLAEEFYSTDKLYIDIQNVNGVYILELLIDDNILQEFKILKK